MKSLVTVTEPTDTVVTLAEVKDHLRWDDDELDNLLLAYIAAAVTFVEQATRRALARQTVRMTTSSYRGMELLRPPFRSLVSVGYLNDAGTLQPQDLNDFYIVDGLVPTLVAYSRASASCSDMTSREDAVQVVYDVGYDDGKVPSGLRTAVLLQVQLLADRFDVNEKADIERTRDALLSSFKVHTFHRS